VIDTVLVELDPINTLPKFMVLMSIVIGDRLSPVTLIFVVVPAAVCAITRFPEIVPKEVGVNITLKF